MRTEPTPALPSGVPRAPALHGSLPEYPAEVQWGILEEQVLRYTAGDSSSVPVELAEELLQSVNFTLKFGLSHGISPALPPREILALAQRRLLVEKEKAKALYHIARCGTPLLGNAYFRQTLSEINGWLTHYDIRFFAHLPPSGIDYPLLLAVSEKMQGVDYTLAYLRQLLAETQLVACFPPGHTRQLLAAWLAEWPELCVNLCEPVLLCGLGRVLLGEDPHTLSITAEGQRRLWRLLRQEHPDKLEGVLSSGLPQLLNQLEVWQQPVRGYFHRYLPTLLPRLKSADSTGWQSLFLSFP